MNMKSTWVMNFWVVLMALLLGCAGTPKSESTGQYVDDTAITAAVKAAILNDPELKVLDVNVETFKGVVQLSGFVNSKAASRHAVAVAKGVNGVVSVKNDMVVK